MAGWLVVLSVFDLKAEKSERQRMDELLVMVTNFSLDLSNSGNIEAVSGVAV